MHIMYNTFVSMKKCVILFLGDCVSFAFTSVTLDILLVLNVTYVFY